MTVPGIWQLVRTNSQCSCYCQQRINCQRESSYGIATTGRRCNRIRDRRGRVKDMTVPGVWQLVRANSQCSGYGQQWIDSQCQCSDRITTTGCTGNSIGDGSG